MTGNRMDMDLDGHFAAVTRSVRPLQRDGREAHAVTLSRSFDASLDNLWDAATNPSDIGHWFLPITGDLKLGGHYQLEGNAGGRITACRRPSSFSLTWESGGGVSWLDVALTADDERRTRMALTHTSLVSEHWRTFGPGGAGVGWELAMIGLALHLEDPAGTLPGDVEFAESTDGRRFIAALSDDWSQAGIESGTEPNLARSAAARTTAFYTGMSVEAE
jgi:uncharacterized protein YndB with AHSA1/START domain